MKMRTGSECRRNYVGEEMKRDALQTHESIYTFQLMTLASELKIWLSPLFLGIQVIKLPPLGLASLFLGCEGRAELSRTRSTTQWRVAYISGHISWAVNFARRKSHVWMRQSAF